MLRLAITISMTMVSKWYQIVLKILFAIFFARKEGNYQFEIYSSLNRYKLWENFLKKYLIRISQYSTNSAKCTKTSMAHKFRRQYGIACDKNQTKTLRNQKTLDQSRQYDYSASANGRQNRCPASLIVFNTKYQKKNQTK